MPTGTFRDVTADANRSIYLKRKATALFNRVERLVDSLSSSALTSSDESVLHVRLELIDELQESFKNVLGELEELDLEEIERDLSEKFDDILVILKSSVRSEISKRASQHLSQSTFADGITPGVFGPQQRQPRHRAALLPPLELPKFVGGYGNWTDFYSMFTAIIDSQKLEVRGPCLRQFNSYVGVKGILSGAAMQDVGDYGFRNGNVCTGQSGGK